LVQRMGLPLLLALLSSVLDPARALEMCSRRPADADVENFELPPRSKAREHNVSYPETGAASKVLERLGVDHCGAIRYDYKCKGGLYDHYMEEHGAELESIYSKAAMQNLSKRILFFGNSHIREVAESYLCQRRHLIQSWRVVGPDYCLHDVPYSTTVDGSPYQDDLSRATFRGGGLPT